jgi:hypothetical protein
MRADKHDARLLKEVAAIRGLQRQAAEMAAALAEAERRGAAERHAEGREAVLAAEAGWSSAIDGGAFELSRAWLHALAAREDEAQALGRAEDKAANAATEQRRAFQTATARSDAAGDQARIAARVVARRRDEAGLAMVEDGFAARRRQT